MAADIVPSSTLLPGVILTQTIFTGLGPCVMTMKPDQGWWRCGYGAPCVSEQDSVSLDSKYIPSAPVS